MKSVKHSEDPSADEPRLMVGELYVCSHMQPRSALELQLINGRPVLTLYELLDDGELKLIEMYQIKPWGCQKR